RNPIIENLQGNRNPFIDNPALATSIWGGPQAEDRFGSTGGGGNTLCGSNVSSFPYTESFESNFGDWVQANAADDFNWERRSGGTPSSNTGPGSASAGSQYIYMESSTPNYSTKRAILYGPCFDLSGAGQADFSFKYHMYGASNMGSLTLEASLDGTSWTTIWSASGNQGNSWQAANVDLDSYAGDNVQLRLNGVTGTTWRGDMAVDDLELTTDGGGGGSGPTATNLRITFDNYPEETSWLIRNSSNTTVASGGTYNAQADGSTLNIPVSLSDGCYTLVFSDTYGDGICCSYGNGSYALTNSGTGATLASGGSFGSTDTKTFCVGGSSRQVDETPVLGTVGLQELDDFSFFPNPAGSTISVRATARTTYVIANQTGQVVQQGIVRETIDLTKLARGSYFLTLANETATVTKILVKQ
ncbi:MAG: T9SS type A sorting domain-containing protein, partial [Lewinella sp.]